MEMFLESIDKMPYVMLNVNCKLFFVKHCNVGYSYINTFNM